MADAKKTTKKTETTEKSLQEQLAAARQTLLDAKKSHRSGELVNPRAITAARKDVARIMTQLNAQEGGK